MALRRGRTQEKTNFGRMGKGPPEEIFPPGALSFLPLPLAAPVMRLQSSGMFLTFVQLAGMPEDGVFWHPLG